MDPRGPEDQEAGGDQGHRCRQDHAEERVDRAAVRAGGEGEAEKLSHGGESARTAVRLTPSHEGPEDHDFEGVRGSARRRPLGANRNRKDPRT
ncbi:hypothetical protein GCM10009853_024480 [Glycomyces scopariae]